MSVNLRGTGRRVVLENGRREMSRDLDFLMHPRRAEAAGVVRRHWLSPGGPLDQRKTSECVIHCFDKYLTTQPCKNPGFRTTERRTEVYHQVQDIDEWPGRAYDGTSTRAMMRWAKDHGWIKDYHWTFQVQALLDHVLVDGPANMGTVWDDQMMDTDKYGYIANSQQEADDAGHGWLIIGADREKKHSLTHEVGAFRGLTSWGNWGKFRNSRFWISFSTVDKLLRMAGEAAIANEILTGRRVASSEEFNVA
jgi:hypothetical protein